MKILIAADMEGVAGVVQWEHVTPGHPEYERFRELMTAEVNAAALGALQAGATEVTVTDGHWHGRNILIEGLDPRVQLNSGSPAPLSMVQGVEAGVDAAMFIGYHARMGTENAILDHTWSDDQLANVWINDRLLGETGTNAAMCGHYGVPVLLVSGDAALCAEACELLGPIEAVVTKHATGRFSAECLHPEVVQRAIHQAAERAVTRLRHGQAPAPLRLESPLRLAMEFHQSDMADRAARLPGASRQGRTLFYTAEDMPTLYSAFRALLALSR